MLNTKSERNGWSGMAWSVNLMSGNMSCSHWCGAFSELIQWRSFKCRDCLEKAWWGKILLPIGCKEDFSNTLDKFSWEQSCHGKSHWTTFHYVSSNLAKTGSDLALQNLSSWSCLKRHNFYSNLETNVHKGPLQSHFEDCFHSASFHRNTERRFLRRQTTGPFNSLLTTQTGSRNFSLPYLEMLRLNWGPSAGKTETVLWVMASLKECPSEVSKYHSDSVITFTILFCLKINIQILHFLKVVMSLLRTWL